MWGKIAALARQYGINRGTLYSRIHRSGMSVEQAISLGKTSVTGKSFHPLYYTWRGMMTRCYNKKCRGFKNYGGRGITVCDRWRWSLSAFVEDVGPRPRGCSIDRIDNDQGYFPGNVRWANIEEQMCNRQNTIRFNGKALTLACRESGIIKKVVQSRLERGWSIERALSVPRYASYAERKLDCSRCQKRTAQKHGICNNCYQKHRRGTLRPPLF